MVEQDEARRDLRRQDRGRATARSTPTRAGRGARAVVRALRPHIGARLPLPGGTFLGVHEAQADGAAWPPPAAACAPRATGCCSTARRRARAARGPAARRPADGAAGLAARPPRPRTSHFWLDPRLPARSVDDLIQLAISDWGSDDEWAPYMAALAWRGDEAVLAAAKELSRRDDPRARAVAAYVPASSARRSGRSRPSAPSCSRS